MERLNHELGTIVDSARFGELYGDGEDLVQQRGYWLPETYPGDYTSEGRSNLWKFHPLGIMVFDAASMTVETYEVFNFKLTKEGQEAAEKEFNRMLASVCNGRRNEFRFGEPPIELYEYASSHDDYRSFCGPWLASFIYNKWKMDPSFYAYSALASAQEIPT